MYRKNLDAAFLAAASTPGAANPLVTATEQPWEETGGKVGVKADRGANGVEVAIGATSFTIDGDASTGDWASAEANVEYAAGAWGNASITGADLATGGTPSGTTPADGSLAAIFNGSDTYACQWNAYGTPPSVIYDFASPIAINAYRLMGSTVGAVKTYAPTQWEFYVRETTGSAWVLVDDINTDTITYEGSGVTRQITTGLATVASIKLTITANGQGLDNPQMGELDVYNGTIASSSNLITSENIISAATSFNPSPFVAKDESNAAITGNGKFLIDYNINGAGMTGTPIEQSAFKALPLATFSGITSLALQIQLVGMQKMSSVYIESISSGGLMTKAGSITLTVNNSNVIELQADGDGVFADISADDIHLTGGIDYDDSLTVGYRSVATAAGTTTGAATDNFVEFTGTTTQTYTLPACASGRTIVVKNSSTGSVTVNPAGADTIDGGSTLALATQDSVTLIGSDTNWTVN